MALTLGRGDAIEFVEVYVGHSVEMPLDAYGFVLGYYTKSLQNVSSVQELSR